MGIFIVWRIVHNNLCIHAAESARDVRALFSSLDIRSEKLTCFVVKVDPFLQKE